MTQFWLAWIYAVPLLLVWAWYLARRRRAEARSVAMRREAEQSGLTEPVSLHPIIDANLCLGCGACVRACPEQPEHQVLGLISGKAQLVSPTDCIGHGACKAACPTNAISLVFGTERRGVTIPVLSPEFESSVPGIFIAGELGGMGLIKNAITQGRQAVEAMHDRRSDTSSRLLDVLIVGAGPAGFSAALAAKALKMRFVVIEQESLGGCIFQYPRGKVVMTSSADLPLIGPIKFTGASKEELLRFWKMVDDRVELKIRCQERVESIEPTSRRDFVVRTTGGTYQSTYVLLAIGRRGTPRKLAIPGEDLPKVVYRLLDPEQYAGKNVLVVGGGNSALETAATLSELDSCVVTLSYRGAAFARATPQNRDRVIKAAQGGSLALALNSTVRRITNDAVIVWDGKHERTVANDAVIVQAGGTLPNDFLSSIGVQVETKYGTA